MKVLKSWEDKKLAVKNLIHGECAPESIDCVFPPANRSVFKDIKSF